MCRAVRKQLTHALKNSDGASALTNLPSYLPVCATVFSTPDPVAPSMEKNGAICEAVMTAEYPASATQSPAGTLVPTLLLGQSTAAKGGRGGQ